MKYDDTTIQCPERYVLNAIFGMLPAWGRKRFGLPIEAIEVVALYSSRLSTMSAFDSMSDFFLWHICVWAPICDSLRGHCIRILSLETSLSPNPVFIRESSHNFFIGTSVISEARFQIIYVIAGYPWCMWTSIADHPCSVPQRETAS